MLEYLPCLVPSYMCLQIQSSAFSSTKIWTHAGTYRTRSSGTHRARASGGHTKPDTPKHCFCKNKRKTSYQIAPKAPKHNHPCQTANLPFRKRAAQRSRDTRPPPTYLHTTTFSARTRDVGGRSPPPLLRAPGPAGNGQRCHWALPRLAQEQGQGAGCPPRPPGTRRQGTAGTKHEAVGDAGPAGVGWSPRGCRRLRAAPWAPPHRRGSAKGAASRNWDGGEWGRLPSPAPL